MKINERLSYSRFARGVKPSLGTTFIEKIKTQTNLSKQKRKGRLNEGLKDQRNRAERRN